MKNKEKVDLVLNQIEEELKTQGFEVVSEYGHKKVNGVVNISFDGVYNNGRFGSQEKDWISVRGWIDGKNENRRVSFGRENQVEKVIEKVKELIQLNQDVVERENREKNELQNWRTKMKETFEDVEFTNFSKDKEFLIKLEKKKKK